MTKNGGNRNPLEKNNNYRLKRKKSLIKVLIVLFLISLNVGEVGAVTNINSCTNITSSGEHVLTTDINNASTCITITSSDVVFDGGNFTINGTGTDGTYGVYVKNASVLTNVTVKNLYVTNWEYGIYYSYTNNGNITNTNSSSNSYGIYLDNSYDNTIYNNYFNNTNNARDNIGECECVGNNFWNTTRQTGTNILGGSWLGGNYWSDYSGNDTDGDGIGDTELPYNASGNITLGGDYLPLSSGTSSSPFVVTIISPENNSVNTTGIVNVTATLNKEGTAILNWKGRNYTMNPPPSQPADTVFYREMKNLLRGTGGLLSGNFIFKVYGLDSEGLSSVSETMIVTVNRKKVDKRIKNFTAPSTGRVNKTLKIKAPSGKAEITINNGTNATIHGVPITEITVDSLDEINSTYSTFSLTNNNEQFVGENLSLGPKGAQFDPPIQVRFNYTDEELDAAGIEESELTVKYYNTSSGEWEEQSVYEHNMVDNYTIVNISHFSTFALIGMSSSETPTSSSSSGGSSGGAGVSTSEPYDNIEKAERQEKDLIANTPVSYNFRTPELCIYEIVVTGEHSEYDVALRVETLKGTSKLVNTSAPGMVYENVNVWAGSKRIKEAIIKFKVENSWIDRNNLVTGDIRMIRWDGSKWVSLETTENTKDNNFTFYKAKTDSFSALAITGLKYEESKVQTTETEDRKTEEMAVIPDVQTEKSSGFGVILAILTFILINIFRNRR